MPAPQSATPSPGQSPNGSPPHNIVHHRVPPVVARLPLAGLALVLMLLSPATLRAIEPVAPGLGLGPQTPRPKLDTLPTPPFVPGEIIVKYQTMDQGKPPQVVTPRARVGQLLADRLEGLPVSRRPLFKALHPNRFGGAQREALLVRRDRRERFGLRGVDVYEVPPAADLRALCRWLTGLEEVEQAHPNYTFPLQFLPDDPF